MKPGWNHSCFFSAYGLTTTGFTVLATFLAGLGGVSLLRGQQRRNSFFERLSQNERKNTAPVNCKIQFWNPVCKNNKKQQQQRRKTYAQQPQQPYEQQPYVQQQQQQQYY